MAVTRRSSAKPKQPQTIPPPCPSEMFATSPNNAVLPSAQCCVANGLALNPRADKWTVVRCAQSGVPSRCRLCGAAVTRRAPETTPRRCLRKMVCRIANRCPRRLFTDLARNLHQRLEVVGDTCVSRYLACKDVLMSEEADASVPEMAVKLIRFERQSFEFLHQAPLLRLGQDARRIAKSRQRRHGTEQVGCIRRFKAWTAF
jgi:hypothetical protein